MQRHGWTLLFHDGIKEQICNLEKAINRIKQKRPAELETSATYKLYAAISHLVLDVIPKNPNSDRFRQGNTMGTTYRHWRRAKIGRRFRLFFRFDSQSKVIVYAWVNDARSLRKQGSKSDPYAVFTKMLEQGNPPDDWESLVKKCHPGTSPFQGA
ncbi:type II toxin-antitoxin system YhaV family toxin [Desulfoplanes formicivorans]|uniref:Toxin YhaV n=1 Tax=Desulfoplanes formicivorans TaxID=1592317 RepID=A0A194AHW9_9BACT|nr:type II toxin-antitoxin system YhaV family toxin [Desulfoplanes formicivorans]GAU08820.1 toxin YhaV [Desulfoplanes formicivorans]